MTAQEVFEIALTHMDEVDENGEYTDDDAYKAKAPVIIDALQRDIARIERVEPNVVTYLADVLVISDDAAKRVLPYGVAARLSLADGLNDFFMYFQSLYDAGVRQLGVKQEDFADTHGVFRGF